MTAPSFDEPGRVLAENRRQRRILAGTEPAGRAETMARQALFGPHPWGRTPWGRSDPLAGRDVAALRLHGDRTLVRSVLDVRLVNVPEAEVVRIRSALADLPARRPVDAPLPAEVLSEGQVFVRPGPSTAVVWLGRVDGDDTARDRLQQGLIEAAGASADSWPTTDDPSTVGVVVMSVDLSALDQWIARMDAAARNADIDLSARRVAVVTPDDDALRSFRDVEETRGVDVQGPMDAASVDPVIGPDDVVVLEE